MPGKAKKAKQPKQQELSTTVLVQAQPTAEVVVAEVLPPEDVKVKTGRPKFWTEAESMKLGTAMLDYLEANEGCLYWEEFIYEHARKVNPEWARLCPQRISEMTSQYPAFAELVKRAKKLQELRLLRKEGKGEIKSIFVLKNHHGYADKQETKSVNVSVTLNKDISKLKGSDEDALSDTLRWLTDGSPRA